MNLTINVNDTSLYPSYSPILAAGTVITINGVPTSGINTLATSVTDNTMVTIEVSKAGYNVYSNTIRVYGYAVTMEIFLTTVGDLTPYPSFKSLIEPCSFNVTCYDTTAISSSITPIVFNWTVDGIEQGRTRNISFATNSSGTAAIELGVTILTTVTYTENKVIPEYRPQLFLTKTVDSGCSQDDSCCSATSGAEVTITPDITLNITEDYIVCADSTIEYVLYDYSGNLIDTVSYTIPNNTPVIPSSYTFVFTPTILGDYKIVATLENCCSVCTTELIVKVCDTVKVQFTSCGVYTISNCSLTDSITYSLNNADNSPVTTYQDITVGPGMSTTFNTPSDGVYRVVVDKSGTDAIYLVVAYCTIQNCILGKLKTVLCTDCGCDDNCKDYCRDRFELNRILPLTYIVFSYVNREYALNRVYDVIDIDKSLEILGMQSVIEQILNYCDNCSSNSLTPSTVIGSSSSNDCGCS